ncbi:crotonase/enoyl-CoA hydratase family protein [Marinovum sp. 2_MG-2023]|uniref:crotonase/enoyl-CoA hydratase family protein n=1 Tax=unclassified Marinovum TaxID=2647166 RepID=UPI0026E2F05C|nr:MULTISPECIES: crotonase/enoyl-CoA hydratase family protein [unclassified Marinovum]MDO6732504.1 crotonase/enoyl-CoA hydratase family protein [Marinovum sp. 2_MG-2023]MDO6780514.1 crotonase/enoyl-CoA hydratase family protein [Marinovum sp. 1_MG-2023]
MYQTLKIESDARGVATLWLARSEKHNAMSAEMLDELVHAAQTLGADDTVRVVVLAAEGKTFCAGGDLAWMRAQFDMDSDTRRRESAKLSIMLQALDRLPKPVIGRVQGNAFGGGMGLMSVCDVVIAAQGLRFGFTETRLGLIPANIGPFVLRRMGAAMARRVFMSARLFDSEEAVTLGLVAKAVQADELDQAVEDQILPYLSCAPGAVGEAKALIQALGGGVGQSDMDLAIDALANRWNTDEAQEGISAFFDKRPPQWV